MLRWGLYAFRWALIIAILMFSGIYAGQQMFSDILENEYFQGIFLFSLPFLLAMVILGGIGCLIKSAWNTRKRTRRMFCLEKQQFVDSI